MKYIFNRLEARVIPELDSRENVVRDLVVGMTGVDDNGVSAYRDTLVRLPDPDDSFIPFADIDEAWVLAIAEGVAKDNGWKESIDAEVEAAKTKPHPKRFSWQVTKEE